MRSRTSWDSPDVLVHFATAGYTDAGERAALDSVPEQRRGRVLDIGIGGGRTTGLLAPHARSYVGVDVTPGMVELARSRFPGEDLRLGDACHLDLADRSCDLVVFSFNGLDALDHQRRARALAEMSRVLAPGGRVVFSSLNLAGPSFDERPWRFGGLRDARDREIWRAGVLHPLRVARGVRNYRHTRGQAERGADWARCPLRAHEFRFVVHFATIAATTRMARDAGLVVERVFADTATTVDPASERCDVDYAHFVCSGAQDGAEAASPARRAR